MNAAGRQLRAQGFAWRDGAVSMTTAGLNPPPANPSPAPPIRAAGPAVHEISGWRRALLWPFGLLIRLWGMIVAL